MAANNSNTSGIQRARQIGSTLPTSPMQQAQGIAQGIPPYTVPTSTPVAPPSQPVGVGNVAASGWGPANAQNAGFRAGQPTGYEPPVIFYNVPDPVTGIRVESAPNPAYVATLPPPPEPKPEGPITQSVASSEVDRLIEQSKEVVGEINTNTPPNAPPVVPVQEIVKPPAPITPTELVLAAQANCEGSIRTQDINIEIINEINMQSFVTASATANAFATSSAFASVEGLFKKGCMDPDATNYDPEAMISDDSCEYLPPEVVKGCTNIDALNFNPDATEDDGSCTFEPVLPPIPPMSQFLDSHGQLIFEVPKELVEDEGVVDMPKGNNVKITATRALVNPKAENPIVRPAPIAEDVQSDLILTTEELSVSTRKQIRKQLIGGQLASDNVAEGEKDIIIRNVVNDTSITRNEGGAILITTNAPILKASLQSQAFIYEDYRKAIDTSFSELVGKM